MKKRRCSKSIVNHIMDSEWSEVVKNRHVRTQFILDELNFSYIFAAKELASNIFTNIANHGEYRKDMFAENFPHVVAAVVLYITGMMHKTAPILEDLLELSKLKNKLTFEKKIEILEGYIDTSKMEELKRSLVSTGSDHEKGLISEIVISYMHHIGECVKIKAENARQKSTVSNRYNIMITKFVDTTICLLSDVEHIFCGKASAVIGKSAVFFVGNECLFSHNAEAPNSITCDKLKAWIATGHVSNTFLTHLTSMRRWLNFNIADAANVIRISTPEFRVSPAPAPAPVPAPAPAPVGDASVMEDEADDATTTPYVEAECVVILPPPTP